jgi:hypothetical protein
MEDKVRMVGVRRWLIHTRVDPTWASPKPPSPLSIPPRPYLPGSPASGTTRVPAPLWKRCAIRRVRKCPRCRVSALASTCLLSNPAIGGMPHTAKFLEATLYLSASACQASSSHLRRSSVLPPVALDPHRSRVYRKSCRACQACGASYVLRSQNPAALGQPCRCGQPPV